VIDGRCYLGTEGDAGRAGTPAADKGYFVASDELDWGGSGPFDMRLDEVIERATRAAQDKGLRSVIVIRKP
jgi:hypothetical protein